MVAQLLSSIDAYGTYASRQEYGIGRLFADFIICSTSYNSLTLGEQPKKIITLVEDIPGFKSELCSETVFHDILRNGAANLRNPLCFILTSNVANSEAPDLSRLFPQHLRDELNICTIKFVNTLIIITLYYLQINPIVLTLSLLEPC